MSRQSEAKKQQGYTSKAIPRVCMNCVNFEFERVQTHKPTNYLPDGYFEDKNLRCTLGDFAVRKMGSCNGFKMKDLD